MDIPNSPRVIFIEGNRLLSLWFTPSVNEIASGSPLRMRESKPNQCVGSRPREAVTEH
jgi:hypothetical protein